MALCVFLVAVAGCSSYRVLPQSEMRIQNVIEVEGANKKQLFDKSRQWYAAEFHAANSVIQYENEGNGTIMGNGLVEAKGGAWKFRFSIATEVKDGKARVTIIPLSVNNNHHGEEPITAWYWEEARGPIRGVAYDYENFLTNKAEAIPGNW